jgi:tryptophan-rich sensory protein
LQLALNALWSYLFFGLRMPGLAFLDIVALFVAIVLTAMLFWRYVALAGVLMLPYIVWVGYASTLNWAIWRMNP